ncbi:MAG: hypothetical protein HKN63_11635 [Rhodobacteraceae bacterium]|nr:hypothetical protein [Paracoccaceae bacterium]
MSLLVMVFVATGMGIGAAFYAVGGLGFVLAGLTGLLALMAVATHRSLGGIERLELKPAEERLAEDRLADEAPGGSAS